MTTVSNPTNSRDDGTIIEVPTQQPVTGHCFPNYSAVFVAVGTRQAVWACPPGRSLGVALLRQRNISRGITHHSYICATQAEGVSQLSAARTLNRATHFAAEPFAAQAICLRVSDVGFTLYLVCRLKNNTGCFRLEKHISRVFGGNCHGMNRYE